MLYRTHRAAITAYVRRRVPAEAVEDIVADIFLVCWRRRDRVPVDALPWLYAVALRTVANDRRSTHRRLRRRDRLMTRCWRTRLRPLASATGRSSAWSPGRTWPLTRPQRSSDALLWLRACGFNAPDAAWRSSSPPQNRKLRPNRCPKVRPHGRSRAVHKNGVRVPPCARGFEPGHEVPGDPSNRAGLRDDDLFGRPDADIEIAVIRFRAAGGTRRFDVAMVGSCGCTVHQSSCRQVHDRDSPVIAGTDAVLAGFPGVGLVGEHRPGKRDRIPPVPT